MKTVKAYWENFEFNPNPENSKYSGYMVPIRHFVTFEVKDDATDEEIQDIAKRKDFILVK